MDDTRTSPSLTRYWQVKVTVAENGDRTHATAVLSLPTARELQGTGHSSRDQRHPPTPRIGDEVAVARALRALADRVLEAAASDIGHVTGDYEVSLHW